MPKIIVFICLLLVTCDVSAQEAGIMSYTKAKPLVYEDAQDLWPYSFLNAEGKPEGYNIELVDLLMKELNIPYIVRLKPQHEVFMDLKDRKADLTLGLAAGYHDAYGLYGHNAITLFTQSVATPKSQSVEIKTFRDLSKPDVKVIVSDSSLCHHLMLDYGWAEHAIPCRDMKTMIQQVNDQGEGQIVWNTLALKWLIHHYHLHHLVLTPVKIDKSQSQEKNCQNDGAQNVSFVIDNVLGHNDYYGPVGILHIGIKHPAIHSVVFHTTGAALVIHHLFSYLVIQRVSSQGCNVLDFFLEHTTLLGMYEIGAVMVNDKTIGMLRETFLVAFMNQHVFLPMTQTEPFDCWVT